ncbi:NUDIX domain-containing protein [Arhodomonas sp. AD133]|uniref:NUDIX domain-containing protein n=1 Tax=Arhodomonas sp. AD133 TaxID=3415009 RepID=UPI003EB7A22E
MPEPPLLFVDHHGRIRERPAHRPPQSRSGIHVVLTCHGNLLLTRPPGGTWLELPGGGIEAGESVEEALRRELREEAGVHLPRDWLVAAGETRFASRYYASSRDAYWLYDQRFRLVHLSQRPQLGTPEEDGHQPEWVAIAALHERRIHHVHRLGVDRLLGLHAVGDTPAAADGGEGTARMHALNTE